MNTHTILFYFILFLRFKNKTQKSWRRVEAGAWLPSVYLVPSLPVIINMRFSSFKSLPDSKLQISHPHARQYRVRNTIIPQHTQPPLLLSCCLSFCRNLASHCHHLLHTPALSLLKLHWPLLRGERGGGNVRSSLFHSALWAFCS